MMATVLDNTGKSGEHYSPRQKIVDFDFKAAGILHH